MFMFEIEPFYVASLTLCDRGVTGGKIQSGTEVRR